MTQAPPLAASELVFADGLVGCPEWKHFTLEQRPEMLPVALLKSVDQPNLSFIVADPRTWYPHYKFDVSAEDLKALEVFTPDDLVALTIITVEPDPFAVTANLLGPLVVNPSSGKARQIVQSTYPYQARQPLDLQVRPLTLPEGLIGHPEWKHFVLRKSDKTVPVQLLISRDQPGLSFPVANPWLVYSDYRPQLSAADRRALGLNGLDQDLEWLCLLNVESDPFRVTANLLGPLVCNPRTNEARQVVLSQSGYSAAFVVYGQEFAQALKEVDRASSNPAH
jgi:flagellar assembly factor FliW